MSAEVGLPVFSFGERGPRVLITAGLHGWETTAIAVAWELTDRLATASSPEMLRARLTVMPLCNPGGTLAMSRVEPSSGFDLNRLFPTNGAPPEHPGLAAIGERISQADLYIDMHSAGAATYLPHVLAGSEESLDEGRAFGLQYVLLRHTRDGERGTSLQYAMAHGARAFCLEIGGGTRVDPTMVRVGVDALWRFLAGKALVDAPPGTLTEPSGVYPCDPRWIVKSRNDGIFYALKSVGAVVDEEEVIGYRICSHTWQREPIMAGKGGVVLYLRDEARVRPEDTLAMILPLRSAVDETAQSRTVFA